MKDWAFSRFIAGYAVGSMQVEESEPDVFIGVRTHWQNGVIVTTPRQLDPWGAHTYDRVDCTPLKPWQSWCPPSQRAAATRAMLSRCWYYSSTRERLVHALWETFLILICRADFPSAFVFRQASC